jgi:cation transport regulator ChaC
MRSSAYYFAYGSNMHRGRLRARAPSAELIETAVLGNHRLYFNKRGRDGSGKCTVSMESAGRVYGVVYRISNAQRSALDRAEGTGYSRRSFVVNGLSGGRTYRVFMYRAKAIALDDALRPYDWYRALVVAGAEQHCLPPSYVDYLRHVETWHDPNPRRSRSQFNIIPSR